MFVRAKTASERVAAAAAAHSTAAEQAGVALAAITDAAEEIADTAATMRVQGDCLVILAGVATLAVLLTALVVIRSAAR